MNQVVYFSKTFILNNKYNELIWKICVFVSKQIICVS